MSKKIMTWNIRNGGLSISSSQNILEEIRREDPDVVVIQEYESRYREELIVNGLSRTPYYDTVCWDCPDCTARKRVLIASKMPSVGLCIPQDILPYSRRNWCEREFMIGKEHMRILGVHVPPAETTHADGRKIDSSIEKKIFLDALVKKFKEYSKCSKPCIILGTFNLHSAALYKEYLDIFAEYLTDVTSMDPTCGNYKQDYIFVNEACKKLLKSDEVAKPHWTSFSTHAYLYIEIEEDRG